MRTTLLRAGLTAAAITSALAVAAPAASAQTVWVVVGNYWGTNAQAACQAQGRADVASSSSPAIAFACYEIDRQIKNGTYQVGYQLNEEYQRGAG
ncbi:hypothetical protein [Streptacidiphilus rugosus]|uniref:hypothetical protein n=1 Tax=Streptacidiphilus rugosus TaxID=405783 RepID=UPI000565B8EB|nr:hypothetical protein [Streptacidiphilus rugosus]